jgi:TonB-linked SusC/RagA family outer membrane protein
MKKITLLLVFLLLAGAQMLQAQRTITGTVISTDDRQSIPGVSVVVKGTTTGTTTNLQGQYSLTVPSTATHLMFSFMGMETQEIEIGGRTTIDVTMGSDATMLEEFVVTAYGVARRATFTGSAVAVSGDQLSNRAVTNIGNALEGNVAGVQVTSASGQPGSSSEIRVRGVGSLNYGSNPLIIVDGATFGGVLSNLNPDDIESITVLKDAASTALYGSRAANGVIMITTKSGRSQRAGFDVRVSQGFSMRSIQEYERLGALEYYEHGWQALRNGRVTALPTTVATTTTFNTPTYSAENWGTWGTWATTNLIPNFRYNITNQANGEIVDANGRLNPNAGIKSAVAGDLDWFDPLTRLGKRSEVSISASMSNEKSDMRASFAYLDEEGYIVGSGFKRFSARMNMNHKVNNWFKTGINLSAMTSDQLTTNDESSSGYTNPFYAARTMGPIFPIYARDFSTPNGDPRLANDQKMWDIGRSNSPYGSLGQNGAFIVRPAGAHNGRHVVAENILNKLSSSRHSLNGRLFFDIQLLKDLKFTANQSMELYFFHDDNVINTLVGDGAPDGRSNKQRNQTTAITANQLLNYSKKFNRVHDVEILLGHETYMWDYQYIYAFRQGEIVPDNPDFVNYTTTMSLNSWSQSYRLESYFSRANYSFDDKYIASASFRRDGSSKFYVDNRWGNFWSLGAGWRLDKENFMKSFTNHIPFLKLRTSYGQVGNDAGISYYAWHALHTLGNNNVGEPGIRQSTLDGKDLVWESNNSFDVALEYGLKNGIRGTVEFFHRVSHNLLFATPIPLSAGLAASMELKNVGSMYNQGFEFEIAYDYRAKNDFTWTTSLNLTHFKNEITKMSEEGEEIYSGTNKWKVGVSRYDHFLRAYAGVDPGDGRALYIYDPTKITAASQRVAANLRVIDGDTFALNPAYALEHYCGSSIPAIIGGWTNTFRWKGFDLSILTTFQIGGKIYDGSYAGLMGMGTSYGTALHVDQKNAWKNPGDVTDIPRLDANTTINGYHQSTSDRWLTSASFLSLRSINFGYTLPKEWVNKVQLSGVRVFFSGENLAMFAARKGMNPSQRFDGQTTAAAGYLPSRFLTFGLNVNF